VGSNFGNGGPDGLLNFQREILRVKTHWIEKSLMGSYDPFGYLKHKGWESNYQSDFRPLKVENRLDCMQVTCYIFLEKTQQGL
jgi:hypothetical protein